MRTEAEIRGMWPQAEGCLQPPGAGGDRKDPPLEPLEGVQPCQPPELEEDSRLLFKAPWLVAVCYGSPWTLA